ncbi:MAG: hypothetical protein IT260_06850, partial [Saprospiraceae bacterium]|nr:hypothetical protein [Saprospiraceae bacterium]
MKKRNITLWAMVLLGSLCGARAFAQTNVNMPFNTGVFSTFQIANPAACQFFNFFDNGGAAASYSSSSNPTLSVVTFAPTIAGNKIRVTFSAFATENTFDALYIYDGTLASVADITNTAVNTVIPGQFSSGSAIANTFRAGGWQGTNSPGTIQASAGNATGALTFQFDSDTSVTPAGWSATIVELATAACAMTPAANQTISTGTLDCSATATTALPTFTPGGCSDAFTLQYRVNGGAATVIPAPFPATISIPNLPKATNTI